jgi:hypothetical protein
LKSEEKHLSISVSGRSFLYGYLKNAAAFTAMNGSWLSDNDQPL